MRLGRYVPAALLAVSVSSSPVLAQAANGPSSVPVRASAKVKAAEDLGGGFLSGGGFILPLIAIAAVLLAVVVGTDNDAPVSP